MILLDMFEDNPFLFSLTFQHEFDQRFIKFVAYLIGLELLVHEFGKSEFFL